MRRLSEADIRTIYDACMDDKGLRLSATDVGAALDSPFSLFCKYHVDSTKKDPPDPFRKALSERGIEHESNVLEADYPDLVTVKRKTPEDGFEAALLYMAEGIASLAGFSLFWLPEGLHGYPDVLERREGESAFGSYHYVVREIKLAANIRESHMLQAACYALMLGRIQRRTPEYFLVTNGKGDTARYAYGEYEDKLLEYIGLAARIRGGWEPPAVYGTGAAPWRGLCNEVAIRNDDASLIPKVGPAAREGLAAVGLHTVRDVSRSSVDALMPVKRIGAKTASDILTSARAITENRLVRKGGTIDLPVRSTEVFFDLEGYAGPGVSGDYLIGALVRKGGSENFHAFIAEGRREDIMFGNFLEFAGGLEDPVMYHWGIYERASIRRMAGLHGGALGDGLETARRLLGGEILVDLLPIVSGAFAFPTYGNSVKDIAAWLGFSWRHDNVGATSSSELYEMYADDTEAGREGMQLVLDYNEDDCIATRIVKDWLVGMS